MYVCMDVCMWVCMYVGMYVGGLVLHLLDVGGWTLDVACWIELCIGYIYIYIYITYIT